MQCLILFCMSFWYYGAFISILDLIQFSTAEDITYEELQNLNGTCTEERDTCRSPREFTRDNLPSNNCQCNKFCANMRTCCLDSAYLHVTPTVPEPSCRKPYGKSFNAFIVDSCPHGADSEIRRKCEDNPTGNDNLLLSLVPVTSLATYLTYWNYFCFRCNEKHDEYLYWNVQIHDDGGNLRFFNETDDIVPTYDDLRQSWVVPGGDNGDLIDVRVTVEYRSDLYDFLKFCIADVISVCSENWTDVVTRDKCHQSYMLITSFYRLGFIYYKNPHCALCNFEDLNERVCYIESIPFDGKPFSFSLLLDINTSDGDKVGRKQKCENGYIWDPHFEKCRELKCALPGYVVKDGKCTKTD